MIYSCECPGCGTYSVDRTTFEAFITPQLKERLDEKIRSPECVRAIARFTEKCPRCVPNSEYDLSVEIENAREE